MSHSKEVCPDGCIFCEAPEYFPPHAEAPEYKAFPPQAGDLIDTYTYRMGPIHMPSDSKASNPKQAVGDTKLPLHLVPVTGRAFAALAFLEGGLKYGAHNYKAIGVQASTYYSAAGRHLDKWWSGEEVDPTTGIPHLASALACLMILADATVTKNLTDDRPPVTGAAGWIEAQAGLIAKVKALYADRNPKHYTIKDEVAR